MCLTKTILKRTCITFDIYDVTFWTGSYFSHNIEEAKDIIENKSNVPELLQYITKHYGGDLDIIINFKETTTV